MLIVKVAAKVKQLENVNAQWFKEKIMLSYNLYKNLLNNIYLQAFL